MLGLRKSFHYSTFHYSSLSAFSPKNKPVAIRERYRSAVAHRYPKEVFAFRFRLHPNLALVHGIILHGVESVEQQIEHDLLGCTLSPCTGGNPGLN
jgi:hypothetical protein